MPEEWIITLQAVAAWDGGGANPGPIFTKFRVGAMCKKELLIHA